MAKTKTRTKHELLSDDALTLISWPARIELRCDHAGVEVDPEAAPHDDPERQLVYAEKCPNFGQVEVVELTGPDDLARLCPDCEFNRTMAAIA
jgi:hypothetical protein